MDRSTHDDTRRTALITGASSGIGEAFADVFAAHGFDLVITARRADRLRAVADRLERRYGCRVRVIVEDLAHRDAPVRLCEAIAAQGLTIDALVNNAGYGVPGPYVASAWERHAALIQVMVVSLAELTHRLLPGMVVRGHGRVINVASLAALVPAPAGHTLYAACGTVRGGGPSSQHWFVGSRSDPTSSSSSPSRSRTRWRAPASM